MITYLLNKPPEILVKLRINSFKCAIISVMAVEKTAPCKPYLISLFNLLVAIFIYCLCFLWYVVANI